MAFVLKQDDRFTWPISFDVPVDGGRHQRQTFDGEFDVLVGKVALFTRNSFDQFRLHH